MHEPGEKLSAAWDIPAPDVSQLITEDDTPVDLFAGSQMRLLTEPLYCSWEGDIWVPAAGLGLILWQGTYEGDTELWLHPCHHPTRLSTILLG